MIKILLRYIDSCFKLPRVINNSNIIDLITELHIVFGIGKNEALVILNRYTNLPLGIINLYYSGQEWHNNLHLKINKPNNPSAAEKMLIDYLDKPFDLRFNEGYITFYRNNHWVYQQDLRNNIFWCYFNGLWNVFNEKFSFDYTETQAIYNRILLKPVNIVEVKRADWSFIDWESMMKPVDCSGNTPSSLDEPSSLRSLKPVECEGFTADGIDIEESTMLLQEVNCAGFIAQGNIFGDIDGSSLRPVIIDK